MSITATSNRNDYTGDGATVTFPYTYLIFANGDLQVYVNGVLKTITTDYTVTGAGLSTGGNVVFTSAPASSTAIEILRVEPFTRTSNYVDNDPFAMSTLNKDLDKLTMLCQQLSEIAGRSIAFGTTSLFKNVVLPDLTASAFYILQVNATATGIQWANVSLSTPNPMTSLGDLIVGLASGTPSRLAVGAAGTTLGVSAGSPSYRTPAQHLSDVSLPTSGYLKGGAGPAFVQQATPLPAADGGLGAALPASGYLKGGASAVGSQAVPIPIADGGTNAITAAAARTQLSAAGLPDNNVFTARNEWNQGADIASAAALTLGTDGNYFHVTGTTTITSISSTQKGTMVTLEFTGALTLTNNANIILGGGVNLSTVAGMVIELVSEGGGVYRQRAPASTFASATVPTGAISMWGTTTAPTGWLLCDGSAVSRTTQAALFAVIGTTFGAGDGSTTFNVPDARGRVGVGTGQGTGLTNRTLAGTGGEETHALSTAELAAHTHPGAGVSITAPSNQAAGGTAGWWAGDNSGSAALGAGGNTGSTGNGTGHNTMQPFLVLTYIIKT